MLGKVVAEEVKIPGKKRGYARLRFRIDVGAALSEVLGAKLPASVLAALDPHGQSDEFVIDLGAPTRLDKLGPQIVAMRREGVKWTEIAERTGLSLDNAYAAFKRLQNAGEAA
jgi:hypothetical protein